MLAATVVARLGARLGSRLERIGFGAYYRLADLAYTLGPATPKRTVAGTYWSYEPANSHGDDPGLSALDGLARDATIYDVGAHVGEYAIPLAVDADRRIVAFEPNAESADRFERNLVRNGTGSDDLAARVDLYRLGIGDTDGTRPFYRSTFSKLSSFDRDAARRYGASIADVEPVPIRRLDALADDLPPPDGIKIDVEGHELSVLRGAAATVEAHRPLVVLERHPGASPAAGSRAIHGWLDERGYDVDRRGDTWVCRG